MAQPSGDQSQLRELSLVSRSGKSELESNRCTGIYTEHIKEERVHREKKAKQDVVRVLIAFELRPAGEMKRLHQQ